MNPQQTPELPGLWSPKPAKPHLKAKKRGGWRAERDAPLAVREMLRDMERHLDAIGREEK